MALQVWLPLTTDLHNQGLLNDVTISNRYCTYESGGKIGGCYHAGVGQDLILNKRTSDLFSDNHSFTIAIWTKFISAPVANSGIFASMKYLSEDTAGGFGLVNKFDKIQLLIAGTDFSETDPVGSFITPEIGKWIHIAATYDNSTSTYSLYLNGSLIKSNIYTAHTYVANNQEFVLGGCSQGGWNSKNDICLNDVRLYDHCLSPKEVKEIAKGLVLHYPLNDAYVEGTSNINTLKTITDSCYNKATNQYGYGPTTDIYRVDGIFQGKQCTKVYMGTDGLDAHPYVGFYPLHPANGTYKTLSFDYFPTICNNIVFYTYGGSATTSYVVNGIKSTSSDGAKTIPVNIGQWNHIEFTLLGTSDSTGGWHYMQIGNTNHTSSTSNYWLFANVQIEEKDHATPYTPNTRNETTVYDCSGYQNNGTISGALNCIGDSPRYKISTHFTSSIPSRINLPSDMSCLSGNNEQTLSCWVKSSGLGSGMTNSGLIALGYGNSLFLNNGDYCYRIDDGSGLGSVGANQNPHDGNWHLVTATYKSGIASIYVDGVLKNSVSRTFSNRYINIGGNCIGTEVNNSPVYNLNGDISDIRMYTTALSADDIKELYNTSAYVLDNGTLLTYSVEE